ncbi:MAG: hypothetical protein ACHQUB_02815 [Candidatus Saccharimonadia bacterium]
MSRMPTRELSIEYAHIYTNQKINEEHELSLKMLNKAMSNFPAHEAVLAVLVDDYSFPDETFDYGEFTEWLGSKGYRPDVLLRESQLIPVCDEIIKVLNDSRLKTQLDDYIQTKRYPCSLFIAAWYLLRLDYIEHSIFDTGFAAKNLLNILPKSFKPFEEKAFEIIEATPYKEAVNFIDYRFMEGRLIV